ncbi:paired box protein Pax-6-like [Xyrichtys novacula]|uniref:Paired box protein Pax-6-like n=1 Tax=Xyrichtys novacula TaxID=13765 RepID=A0AAV1GG85_XYRNO|nr:paired box protein Pax-6-like [Xyrichtys novacula]
MKEKVNQIPAAVVIPDKVPVTMRRQLSAAICNRIVGMRQAGAKQNAIATALGITQGAVSKILKRHRQTGVPTPRPRSGRPRKTTVREDHYLHRLSRTGRTKTST